MRGTLIVDMPYQHYQQHSTDKQPNPRRWGITTTQYDNTNNRYLDIKYVSERIGNSWISAPNYLNTNSVVTACFLPSLPLTGDACSVPDTECSIFLNFPNCLIFYVSNCLILQPPLPSPPPLPTPIKYMKIHNCCPIKSKSTDFFFHFVYSRWQRQGWWADTALWCN